MKFLPLKKKGQKNDSQLIEGKLRDVQGEPENQFGEAREGELWRREAVGASNS